MSGGSGWSAWGVIGTWVAAVAAVLALPLAWWLARDPATAPPDPSAGATVSAGPATTSTGGCVTSEGVAVGCSDPSALVPLAADGCSVAGVLSRAGVAAPWGVVDLEVVPADDVCLVGPGERAADFGATAVEVAVLPEEGLSAVLRVCLRAGREVPCSAPHDIEPVTDWQPGEGSVRAEECRADAESFTRRGLADPDNGLTVVVIRGSGDRFRCAVRSFVALDDSVYLRGDAKLPVAD